MLWTATKNAKPPSMPCIKPSRKATSRKKRPTQNTSKTPTCSLGLTQTSLPILMAWTSGMTAATILTRPTIVLTASASHIPSAPSWKKKMITSKLAATNLHQKLPHMRVVFLFCQSVVRILFALVDQVRNCLYLIVWRIDILQSISRLIANGRHTQSTKAAKMIN